MRIYRGFLIILLGVLFFGNAANAVLAQQTSEQTNPSEVQKKTCPPGDCPPSGDVGAPSQSPSPETNKPAEDNSEDSAMTLKKVFMNLPGDQKAIWTSPFHFHATDAWWLAPMVGTTGLLIGSDRHNMEVARSNPAAISRSNTISNAGVAGLTALPAAMWAWGSWQGNARQRETGLLAGEALANSLVVSETLKVVFARQRPLPVGGQGKFFTDISNGSFPSMHSTLAWSAASVLAHEYPGTLTQLLAYSAAATVSISRVTGRQHFPSDVVVGGAAGWLIGRQSYRAHHDQELDGGQYGHFIPEGRSFEADQTGTTDVPLDSWVYQALDRLAAMGYIETAQVGLRPWTRRECARLVEEAGQKIDPDGGNKWASEIDERLAAEFAPEIEAQATQPYTRIEETYTRVGGISGQPLADGYYFAKTNTDDFGRPFGQGINAVTGASARTVVGPLAFYARGEYQHAGTLPALNGAAQKAIINDDGLPFAPPQRTATLDRFRPLDAYVSLNFHNNLISFGKQTLWWGPGEDGPFLFSNNAEPLPMLRISRSSPIVLPWLFRLLGGIRVEFLWGRLDGYQFVRIFDAATPGTRKVVSAPLRPHPFMQGQKISFKPTRNLEFGFGVTSLFSGPGFPLTLGTLKHSYSLGNGPNSIPGERGDPGDRRSAFDWSYRVPGLRTWLTFYGDSFTEDEYSPVSFPRKSAFRSGLYLARLPRLSQIDLRAEGIYTDIPSLGAPGVSYSNAHYLSGYTNYGEIIGNAIGREGRGVNIWTTYHFTADNSLQLHYRTQHVNPELLRGGYLRDFDATGTFVRAGNLVFSGTVKYEHWNFPLISTIPKTDLSAGLQVSWRPVSGWGLRKR
jgi:hypothetical protein